MSLHWDRPAYVKGARVDVKYVGARDEKGAIETARRHSLFPSHATAYARLATPRDLGCVLVGEAA